LIKTELIDETGLEEKSRSPPNCNNSNSRRKKGGRVVTAFWIYRISQTLFIVTLYTNDELSLTLLEEMKKCFSGCFFLPMLHLS